MKLSSEGILKFYLIFSLLKKSSSVIESSCIYDLKLYSLKPPTLSVIENKTSLNSEFASTLSPYYANYIAAEFFYSNSILSFSLINPF